MGTGDVAIVEVSRRIHAPVEVVFGVVADPRRHPEFDGSGMARMSAPGTPISGVGDQFLMYMHNDDFGDYEMVNHVVEFEANRRISWAPTRGTNHPEGYSTLPDDGPPTITWTYDLVADGPTATMVTEIYDVTHAREDLRRILRNGERWRGRMELSLEKLAELCERDAGEGDAPPGST